MSADDIPGIRAGLDGLVREQAERRALLERRGEEIKARSQEYMTKQVQAAERYVQHRRELGRRSTRSGWNTEKTRAEPVGELDFEPPGSGAPEPFQPQPQSQPSRRTRRTRADDVEEDDDAFLNNRWRD